MSPRRKRIAAIIALVAVLAALVLRNPIRIRLYDGAFAQVTRGMSEPQIVQLMGRPDRVESQADTAFWDDEVLPRGVATDVRRRFWYSVTFIMPVSWSVDFDENGAVVSKHRWD